MLHIATLALVLASTSPTPQEVREDLDAHPWRPSPSAPVATGAISQTTTGTPTSTPTTPTAKAVAVDTVKRGSGPWQIQLGALAKPDAAAIEQKRFEKILGPGTVEVVLEGGMNKLRTGKYSSKEEAELSRSNLKGRGVDGFVVRRTEAP